MPVSYVVKDFFIVLLLLIPHYVFIALMFHNVILSQSNLIWCFGRAASMTEAFPGYPCILFAFLNPKSNNQKNNRWHFKTFSFIFGEMKYMY